jgi:hypothetical protein
MILFVSGVDVCVGGQQQPSNVNASVGGAVMQGGPVPDTAGKCERISETRE